MEAIRPAPDDRDHQERISSASLHHASRWPQNAWQVANKAGARQAFGFHRSDGRGLGWRVRWHGRAPLTDNNETRATEPQNYLTFPRIFSADCRERISLEKAKAPSAGLSSELRAFGMVGATGIEPVTPTMST